MTFRSALTAVGGGFALWTAESDGGLSGGGMHGGAGSAARALEELR